MLNPKQRRFVDEYAVDLNGAQAAIRAGYSKKTAKEQASRLLTNAHIGAAVQQRLAVSTKKAHLTVERIDQEIARLAFSDKRKLYRPDGTLKAPHEWDDDTAAAVAGVEVSELWEGHGEDREQVGVVKKVKVWDKPAALTLAARRLALLRDKTDDEHALVIALVRRLIVDKAEPETLEGRSVELPLIEDAHER
jgi:phage terminase small subunit